MQQILQIINSSSFTPIEQSHTVVEANSVAYLAATNPADCSVSVRQGAVANIALIHGNKAQCSVVVTLEKGARVNLTQLLAGSAPIKITIEQDELSRSKCVALSLNHNSASYDVKLNGAGAESELATLQLGSDKDNNSLNINMQHLAADCTSRSLSKCVASGESNLTFDGLVYVAQDSQRTSADQNCRCVELSDSAHIVAHPQLEIYADDVKCTHGATMGMIDTDAILYMRQRGLSENQARVLQIEGFATDIIERCNNEQLTEALRSLVEAKLQQM